MVVDHDEIGDGVENLHPVAVGLLDAGEQAGVSERHGSVAGHGFEEDALFLVHALFHSLIDRLIGFPVHTLVRPGAATECKQSGQFSVGRREANQGAIGPT